MSKNPDNFHGFYITENLLLYPDQLAIIKLTYPRLFVRFNYDDAYFASYEDWKRSIITVEWLDHADKPTDSGQVEEILNDCWNFLSLHEEEEERINEQFDDY